jgi:hypothetical protein
MHVGNWWEDQNGKWLDYIKMDLRENGWSVMDWVDVSQDSDWWKVLVNTVMNLSIP